MPETSLPFTAASFNQLLNQKKLAGSRCMRCGALYLPPRAICPKCHEDKMEWTGLSGQGRLAAFTSIYVAPSYMMKQGYGRDNPYIAGVVALDEGVKISARILGMDAGSPAKIPIGAPLTVEFIEQGEGDQETYSLAFRVIQSGD